MLRALREDGVGDRLHHPQARRGARDRRPDHGPAAGQADRHGARGGGDRAEPRAADGRPRRAAAASRSRTPRAGRPGARGRGPARARRPRARGRARALARPCAPARSSRWPGVDGNGQQRARRGDRRACARPSRAASRSAGEDVIGRRRARDGRDAGVAHIPEDRQLRGLVLDFTLAENLALREYRTPPLSRRGLALDRPHERRARDAAGASSTCAAATPGRWRVVAVGRQPAEGCVAREIASQPAPADRPPAHARARRRARSSSSTAASSPSATRAAASCSSRSSPRRCARWPTASS